jgi:hypothetical protein
VRAREHLTHWEHTIYVPVSVGALIFFFKINLILTSIGGLRDKRSGLLDYI